MATKSMSVRIDLDLHREVRRRALEEGVAVEALLRGWLREYAEGAVRVGPLDGNLERPLLGRRLGETVAFPAVTTAGGVVGGRGRKARSGLCEHRVPAEQFCKRCDF
jgi:hypothetical protein